MLALVPNGTHKPRPNPGLTAPGSGLPEGQVPGSGVRTELPNHSWKSERPTSERGEEGEERCVKKRKYAEDDAMRAVDEGVPVTKSREIAASIRYFK